MLRSPINALVQVFDGNGIEFLGKIQTINKQKVTVLLTEAVTANVESPLKIHLGQGISRGEKMDFVIQKAVELGVDQITPLFTERCGVKLNDDRWQKRLQHWRAVAISACEQCGRNKVSEINEPQSLTDWVQSVSAELKLICDVETDAKLKNTTDKINSISLLIGPEGGFDPREIKLAEQNKFISLSLGPRVLRTETAAIAAITLMQSKFGDI